MPLTLTSSLRSFAALFAAVCAVHLNAQVLELQNVVATGNIENRVDDPNMIHDLLNNPLAICNYGALNPGHLGHQFGATCYGNAVQEGTVPQPHIVRSVSGSRLFVDGDGTQKLTVTFKNTVVNYSSTDDPFEAYGHSELDFSADLTVDQAPPGFPVTVHFRYFVFSSGISESENGAAMMLPAEEDTLRAVNLFTFDGNDLLQPGIFNWNHPGGAIGFNTVGPIYGSFDLIPGNSMAIQIQSEIDALIEELPIPNSGNGGFDVDGNHALYKGYIEFSVNPFIQVPPGDPDEKLSFSLDIGSDAAWGEPNQDGNEFFDPGDFYLRDINIPAPYGSLVNDTVLFNTAAIGIVPTPEPRPDSPLDVLPYHVLPDVDALGPVVFDLDGADFLDFSLASWNPVYPWAAPANSIALYPGENFLVSFDDDGPENWSGFPPSLPTQTPSPNSQTYGPGNTEVMGVQLDPFIPGFLPAHYPLLSESTVHPGLGPDPDPTFPIHDDDVDALDAFVLDEFGNQLATHFYFSADREGRYADQLNMQTLDPATIYELIAPGVIQAVITPPMLGLPPGTDIDAFEFGWYGTAQNPAGLLTLFFSVDDDDPLTASENEQGNSSLNPAIIYASFMDGSFFNYSGAPLQDDIDGLTLTDEFLTPGMYGCVIQSWYPDVDGDSFGDGSNPTQSCTPVSGYVLNGDDCDDSNDTIFPGAQGTQQGFDNNCNGVIDPDEDCLITGFEDNDGDGYGDLSITFSGCVIPPNVVFIDGDCDDANPDVYPGAPGTFQGIDNNCNGVIDPDEDCYYIGFEDNDGDGYGDLGLNYIGCVLPPNFSFVGGDCDDANPDAYPGAPGTQQGIDNNCDGVVSGTERLPCQGDLNGDFAVNTGDLVILIAEFGCTQNCGPSDLNQDGSVNSADLVILLALIGIPCP